MPRTQTLLSLSRALIGVAWKDGEVTEDEINLLKDVLFQMPEMQAHHWEELEIYWSTLIDSTARKILFADLVSSVKADEDKRYVRNIFVDMVHLDGEVTDAEANAMLKLDRALDSMKAEHLDIAMTELLKSVLEQRYSALAQNQLPAIIKQKMDTLTQQNLGLDEEELHKLVLTGAMMARVAYIDRSIDDSELVMMDRILQSEWSLAAHHAQVIVDAAVSIADLALDNYRLVREFYEITLPFERVEFLSILFRIAHAHEGIADEELTEIKYIARALKIDPGDYLEAEGQAQRLIKMGIT